MALELVGAVGVKVRPDAKGFRDEAKREILSQLRDLEADVKVKVNPDIERAKLKGLFEDAFAVKDQTVDQNIRVNPIIETNEGKSLEELLADNMPDEHQVRINADTSQAQNNIRELTDEMGEMEALLKRQPGVIDNLNTQMNSTLKKLSDNLSDAAAKTGDLEDAIDDLESSSRKHGFEMNRAKSEAINIERKLKGAVAQRQLLESKYEDQRERWRNASGKAAKAEVALQRDAAKVRLDAAKAEEKSLALQLKQNQKLQEATTKRIAADEKSLKKKNELLKQQQTLVKDLNKQEAEARQTRNKAVAEAKAEERVARKRLWQAHEERKVQEAILVAHEKTTDELEETARAMDPLLEKVEWWKKSLNTFDPSMVVGYYKRIANAHSDMTAQQIADIKEYEKRQLESLAKQKRAAEQASQIRSVFSVANRSEALRGLNRQIQQQLSGNFSRQVLWVDPRLDKDGLKRQLSEVEQALAMTRAGDLEITPVLNERMLKMRMRDLRRRINDEPPVEIPFAPSFKNQVDKNKGWIADFTKGIAGLGIMNSIMDDFRRSAAEVDKMSIALAKGATKLTAFGGALLAAGGSAVHIASDIGKLSGGLLMIPSLAWSAGSAFYAIKKGFEGFGAAIRDGGAALEALPPSAQKAATSISNLLSELDDVMQPAMWRGIGDSMSKAVDAMTQPMVEGLEDTAVAVGKFIAGMSRSFEKFASSGAMGRAFTDMNKGFENAAKGAEPLFDAINRIGAAGARHLPALGQAAADAASKFAKWSEINDKNGNFDKWILDAATAAKQLGSILGSTVGIIGSVGRAAEAAGLPGLGELAKAMDLTNQAAKGDFFQGNMTTILRGAATLARDAGVAFGEIGEALLKQAPLIEHAMESVGSVIRNVGTALADNLGNERLTSGITKLFDDIRAAGERLAGMMPELVNGFGDFAGLAGEIAKGGMQIAEAFVMAWEKSSNLTYALEGLVPILANGVAKFIELVHIPLGAFTDILAGLINVFNGLPGPVQAAIGILGGLTFVVAKVMSSFLQFRTGAGLMTNAMDTMVSRATGTTSKFAMIGAGAERAGQQVRRAGDNAGMGAVGVGRFGDAVRTGSTSFTAWTGNAGKMATETQRAGTSAGGAVGGISRLTGAMKGMGGVGGIARSALSGFTAFLGGPWGVALLAGAAAVGGFAAKMAQESANMKQSVDNIMPTLDSLGNQTVETSKVVASALNEMETSFSFGDLFTEEANTVGEAFSRLGTTSGEMANMMRTDKAAYLETATALKGLEPPLSMGTRRADMMKTSQQELARTFGVSEDSIKQNSSALADAGDAMVQQLEAAERAAIQQDALGAKFQSTAGQTEAFNSAMTVLGDSSMSASDKVSKLQDAIDKYNNGAMTAAGSESAFRESLDQTAVKANELAATYGDMNGVLKDNGTAIDLNSTAGRGLLSVLEGSSTAALDYALNLREQGASAKEVSAALDQGRSSFIENAAAMGIGSDAAGKLYDSMAKIPDEIRKEIALEGADEAANAAANLARDLGLNFDNKEFRAWLDADPERAKRAATDAEGLAREWADSEYIAKLGLTSERVSEIMNEAISQGKQWDGQSFMAWLRADPENAKLAAEDSKRAVEEFYKSEHAPKKIDVQSDEAIAKLNALQQKVREVDSGEDLKLLITADDANFNSVLDRAKARGMEIKDPEAFKAFISANAERFFETNATVDQMLTEFNNKDASADLKADNADANAKTDEAKAKVDEFDGKTGSATVIVHADQAKATMAEVNGEMVQWDGKSATADLNGNSVPFIQAKGEAEGVGVTFDGQKWNATLGADASEVDGATADASIKGAGWDESKFVDAQLGARSERVQLAVDNAIAAAEPWNGKIVDAELGARSERVAGAVANALAAAAPWDGKPIDAQLGARSERVAGAVANAMAAAAPWNGKPIDAQLGARSERVSFAVSNAVAIVNGGWVGKPFDAQLGARSERVAFAVANAVAAASPWVGRVFDAQLGARSERVSFAVGNAVAIASTWQGRVFDAQFGARTERVSGALGNARALGGSWQSSSFDAQFGARTERVDMAMANAMARGNQWRGSSFDAQFGGRTERVDMAKANADARGWHWMGSNFDAQFGARIGGVYSAYAAASAVGNAWASRTFTATLTARKAMADGGIIDKFADGGFAKKMGSSIRRYADGGIRNREMRLLARAAGNPQRENHVAQIATPKTPFRIWAEPETGGESYIPLASSKRARSTKIWEETGNRLGVQWEKYADGGVRSRGASKNSNAGSVTNAGKNVNINVTNHYPQAEPTSVTTNRALQMATIL